MKMLGKVARRVAALKEDDASLTVRYKLLLDFLSTFRTGGGKAAAAAETASPPTTNDAARANTRRLHETPTRPRGTRAAPSPPP